LWGEVCGSFLNELAKKMINYTIAEFLGLFLIAFPFFFFVTILIIRGVFWLIEDFFVDDTIKNVFHHHFHYRDKTK